MIAAEIILLHLDGWSSNNFGSQIAGESSVYECECLASCGLRKHLIFKRAIAFVHSGRRVMQAAHIFQSQRTMIIRKNPNKYFETCVVAKYDAPVYCTIDSPDLETRNSRLCLF